MTDNIHTTQYIAPSITHCNTYHISHNMQQSTPHWTLYTWHSDSVHTIQYITPNITHYNTNHILYNRLHHTEHCTPGILKAYTPHSTSHQISHTATQTTHCATEYTILLTVHLAVWQTLYTRQYITLLSAPHNTHSPLHRSKSRVPPKATRLFSSACKTVDPGQNSVKNSNKTSHLLNTNINQVIQKPDKGYRSA